MAQKKDKDRKQNLINFKNKTKAQMAKKVTEESLQDVKQYPVWKSQEKIEVSGLEWESIYNVLNIFRQAVVASESVMQRNIENGKIEMKYVDSTGKELTPDQIEEYTRQLQEFFAAKQKEASEALPNVAETSPILTETGEKQPTKSDNPLKAV